jgi:hypothetical protein
VIKRLLGRRPNLVVQSKAVILQPGDQVRIHNPRTLELSEKVYTILHSAVSPCPFSEFCDGCKANPIQGRKILRLRLHGDIPSGVGSNALLCLRAEGTAIWHRAAETLSIPGRSWIHRDSKSILQQRSRANCGMWVPSSRLTIRTCSTARSTTLSSPTPTCSPESSAKRLWSTSSP